MKKSLKVFLLYVVLMLADGGLTLFNTPDLALEANPLVMKLHLGWGALITVNLIFFVINFFVCRYVFEKYETVKADVPDMKSYISQLFFYRPDKFIWFFYKLPKNWKPFWASMGYAYIYAACGSAVVRILEWLAVTFDLDMSGYDRFRGQYFYGRFDLAVAVILVILLFYIWLCKEYRKSRASVTAEE